MSGARRTGTRSTVGNSAVFGRRRIIVGMPLRGSLGSVLGVRLEGNPKTQKRAAVSGARLVILNYNITPLTIDL
jgi:hypothetical protein